MGAYTKDDVRALGACLSKYEIEELAPHGALCGPPRVFELRRRASGQFGNFPRK
ncbi:MAG: hypothetical protein V8R77_05235, partial [Dysosmobacter welbionis]|uniref:hypothetical protein n=1 Tax=Dysosmobacter welbionis TaxID=2093857 RepID=UPI00300ED207